MNYAPDNFSYIPLIAYGTWVDDLKETPSIVNRVRKALELGYTHIDTAKNYGTEPFVIQAIKEFGVSRDSRDSVYFTSKISSITDPGALRTDLGHMQYYDLLLLHYPPLNKRSREEFKAQMLKLWIGMENYIRSGITKAIGVSNFYQNHLDLLLEVCDENDLTFPLVNQIEIHPGNLELEYVPYIQSKGILPFAHTPLGGLGSQYILNNEIFTEIGSRIGATIAQVVLAYLLKRKIGVVTSSKNPFHMDESIHAAEFISSLSNKDMEQINQTDIGLGPIIERARYSWVDNSHLY